MRLLAKSAPRCKQLNKVHEIISEEIRQQGPMTFARFMELSLYCPLYGYYEREQDIVGRRGDFYTSVNVGSLFGELLAWQFAAWFMGSGWGADASASTHHRTSLQKWPRPQLVEAGAHDGRLARDILEWHKEKRQALFDRLEYWIIEPSSRRRIWQERTLSDFCGKVHWASDLEQLSRIHRKGITGIIFSNELLDSFPVHRLGWDANRRSWFTWGVTVRDRDFCWVRIENQAPDLVRTAFHGVPGQASQSFSSLELANEFTIEICPVAEEWWRAAASVLQRGKLLTVDYGLTAEELLLPQRAQGTLRSYSRHHVIANPLASPGEQDLTAHVNFSAIQAVGESAGLTTESFLTQEQFLTQILTCARKDEDFGEWSPRRTRQFQTLVHPEHLGRAFRVLIQARKTL